MITLSLKGRANAKLVTIDHGPEEAGGNGMLTLAVPPLEKGQVESILRKYIGEKDGLDNWAEWCEGSARVAHALGENLRDHPEDILRPPGTIMIWDRFISGYGDEAHGGKAKLVLRHLALFEKFGFREPVENEADYIARLIEKADPSITRAKFNEIVGYYQKRRILQGDRTLRIVPKALRVYLWRGWWDCYGVGANVQAMLDEMPETLYAWFMRPFSHAHDVPVAPDVVKKLLHPRTGLFANKAFLTGEAGSRFVGILAEADPEAALALLRTMLGWPDDEIQTLDQGRQPLAFALSRIAVWKNCFRFAAKLLGKLSLGDTSSHSNNALGLFNELFMPMGAATQAPFVDRMALVSELLNADTEFERNLGLAAADEAFNMRGHMRVVGVEFQGARPRIEFWRPTLWDELIVPWRSLLAELMQKRNSTDPAWAVSVDATILGAVENMLLANTLRAESVAAFRDLIKESRNYEAALNYLIRALRYVSSIWPEPIREELIDVLLEMNGTTFEERLRRYVLTVVSDDDLDYDDQEPTERAPAIRQTLAVDAVSDPMRLVAVLPTLLQCQAYHVIQFGQDVAAAAKDDWFDNVVLLEALKLGADGCYYFLSGYLRGVFLADAGRWERLADELLSFPNRWVGLAVACSGVSDKIFERLLVLDREGVMDNRALSVLAHDPIRPELGIRRTRRLIEHVLELRGEQFYETVVELADRSLCIGDIPDTEDENIVFFVLVLGAAAGDNAGAMPEHHWGRLAKRFRTHFPIRDMELFDKMIGGPANVRGLGYRRSLTRIVGQICELHPGETWKRVGEALLGEYGYIFAMWLGDVGYHGEARKQAILHFKVEDIFAWIAEAPAERALCIADVAPRTLEAGAAGDLTRELIRRYGDIPKVGGSLRVHFRTGSWSGPDSQRYSELRDRARQWLTETKAGDTKIQDWLTDYIAVLNDEVEKARIWEERGF